MTKSLCAAALCLGLVLATPAARAAQPTPVPDMKPNLSSMMFMIGTWSCHAMVRGSSRPDTTVNTLDYGGYWIKGHDIAPPFDKFRTRAITTDTWTTMNMLNHQWVSTSVDNFGGFGMATSPGWKGNEMTWTTTVTPDGSTGSDTTTKISDTETKDVATGKDAGGKPAPTVTTTCTKKKSAM